MNKGSEIWPGNAFHIINHQSNFDLGLFQPVNGDGQIYPTLSAIFLTPTLNLARFMASFFSKPTLLLSFSTCVFHVFFGRPHFLSPFTSNSNAFLRTCPSSLLNTCPLPSHSICLCHRHLNHCFLQSQHLHQVLCPLFLHQFCTTHCSQSHHCSLSPSQICYLIVKLFYFHMIIFKAE